MRRPPESQALSHESSGLLLSASALIMIAITDLGRACEELLYRSCVVVEILECVRLYKPNAEDAVASRTRRSRHGEVGISESQDWAVCRRDGLTYVTEDAMEAARIAGDETTTWCSPLQALAALGVGEPELSRCSVRMHRAGCDPSMGRSQALHAYDLLDQRRPLDEEELETLLSYVEATGFLDDLEGASQERVKESE